jgi:hypothetical protein
VRSETTQPASVAVTISQAFVEAMQVPASRPIEGNCRQLPDAQYWLVLHVRPQAPQLRGSFCWSKHWPLHPVVPAGHGGGPASTNSARHVPAVQYSPVLHTVLQFPQWPGSFRRSKHTPLQLESGAWQVTLPASVVPPTVAQVPITHASVAPQARPQAPQLFGLERVSTHCPPHEVCPVAQEATQAPAVHTLPAAHAVPQAPQLRESVWVSTHTPSHVVHGVGAGPTQAESTTSSPAATSCHPSRRVVIEVPVETMV